MAAEACEEKFLRTGDINLCPMLINHFQQCNDVCKAYTYRLEYLKAFYAVQHEIYPTALTNSAPSRSTACPAWPPPTSWCPWPTRSAPSAKTPARWSPCG